MDFNNNIYAVIEPSIMPTKISGNSLEEESGGIKQSKVVGVNEPVIIINGYKFNPVDISSFTLSCSGKIPTLNLTLNDTMNHFSVDSFPRDGDVITFLLASKNEETFKSIHMDFDILSVTNFPAEEGNIVKYSFTGKAKIPFLDSEECRYLDSSTSLNHMEEEAKYLGLGLATNIDATSDVQIRIQPYISHSSFIENIVESSYISDDSFQNWFIDQYYYLNFIEVNRIFNSKNITSIQDAQESLMSFVDSLSEKEEGGGTKSDNVRSKLVLSNHFRLKGFNNYIDKYSIENNSSSIVANHGHFRDVQIYDDVFERLDVFKIDPLTSENMMENEEPLRGTRNEDRYLGQIKHKYAGRQDVGEDGLGNVHQNYVFSKLHNFRNNLEASKMTIKVNLVSFNPSLYKYQKIPVLIYLYDQIKKKSEDIKDEEARKRGFDERQFEQEKGDINKESRLDTFLSGNYIIENIDYSYTKSKGITQTLTLARREWPTRYSAL
jgi:hypothetical protein